MLGVPDGNQPDIAVLEPIVKTDIIAVFAFANLNGS
jgi:hypothetical protein